MKTRSNYSEKNVAAIAKRNEEDTMIRKSAKGYTVVSKDGKKTMGSYPTKAGAKKRLAQVEYHKAKGKRK
jgi:uncharacterized protein YycO